MDFPKVESTLFTGLNRTHKVESEPEVRLDPEQGPPGRIPGQPGSAASTETRLRYVYQSEIGRGGMGAIYRVFDTDLHRTLAMKVALFSTEDGDAAAFEDGPSLLERFLEEAQVTGQLDHPGIVPLHEVGIDDKGRVYFTMRLVKGKHLGEIFEEARKHEDGWTRERVVVVLLRICEAMAYAHSKGVIHRDLKPANVMAGRFGEVYVMDWGLAKVRGRASALSRSGAHASIVHSHRSTAEDADARATMQGSVFGTPVYMSPEQASGEIDHVDERSDVYSVGAILYHLLAGEAPYTEKGVHSSAKQVLDRVLAGPPEPVRSIARDVPAELAAISEKAMARDPEERYPDMLKLADDLRAYLTGRPVSALSLGPAGRALRWCRRNTLAAGVIAAVTVGSIYGLYRLNDLGNDVVRQAALDSTAMQAQMLEDVNALYSSAVASRVDRAHTQVTHDYALKAGAIPIPATFLTDLAGKISQHGSGAQVRQYSDHPFRFRQPWKMDEFERDALVSLRADPAHPVYSFEEIDGRPTLRYTVGRRMEESCVAFHNTHPDSTKTDWKVGEVRGVLEIVRPLDQDVRRMKHGLHGTLVYVGAIAGGLMLLSCFFVLRHSLRERKTPKL
jgi:serine/threonine protein kinase